MSILYNSTSCFWHEEGRYFWIFQFEAHYQSIFSRHLCYIIDFVESATCCKNVVCFCNTTLALLSKTEVKLWLLTENTSLFSKSSFEK